MRTNVRKLLNQMTDRDTVNRGLFMKARTGWLLMAILIGALAFPLQVWAAEIRGGEEMVLVGSNEIINDDVIAGGETVRIEGTVNGDVIVGGGMVIISGVVNGDVWVGGGSIEISGQVQDDVTVAGGSISLRGARIGDDLTVAGGNISINRDSVINGSMLFGAGMVVAEGTIGRSLIGGGGSVTVDGMVNRGVTMGGGQLRLGSQAVVNGGVTYASSDPALVNSVASVSGEIKQIMPRPDKESHGGNRGMAGAGWGFRLWSVLSALTVGWLLLWLAPEVVDRIQTVLLDKPGASLTWGLVSAVLAGPIFLVLLLTMIGIPLAFILLALYLIALYMAKFVVAFGLGNWVSKTMGMNLTGPFQVLVVGLLTFSVLSWIPFIGWLIWFVGTLMGLGAIFMAKKQLLGPIRATLKK